MNRPNRRRLVALAVGFAVLVATPLAVVANDAFSDVPASNVHHDDITWLADAAVTIGCNPPDNTEFCPGDNVTRQQMASFLRRLAENQVVDAGQLNGQDPAAYQTVRASAACRIDVGMASTNCPSPTLPDGVATELLGVSLDVPTAGVVQVHATGLTDADLLWVTVNEACSTPASTAELLDIAAAGQIFGLEDDIEVAGSVAVEAPAGDHTIRFCGLISGSNGAIIAGTLTAEWSEGGSVDLASGDSTSPLPSWATDRLEEAGAG